MRERFLDMLIFRRKEKRNRARGANTTRHLSYTRMASDGSWPLIQSAKSRGLRSPVGRRYAPEARFNYRNWMSEVRPERALVVHVTRD